MSWAEDAGGETGILARPSRAILGGAAAYRCDNFVSSYPVILSEAKDPCIWQRIGCGCPTPRAFRKACPEPSRRVDSTSVASSGV